jgi:hypothetical protein
MNNYVFFIRWWKKNGLNFFLIIFLSYSCKSAKEISAPVATALPKMNKKERLDSIIQAEPQYKTFSSNLKFTIKKEDDNTEITTDAQLRIIKNEIIQLSLRIPLIGSEIFKLLITPDNILVIDRRNKLYCSESMQNIQSKTSFNFDYYNLEALLTNRLFIAGKKNITASDYNLLEIQDDTFLTHISYTDNKNIQYNFTGNHNHRIQSAQINMESNQSVLLCRYADWETLSNINSFPVSVAFSLQIPGKNFSINLSLKSVNINTEFEIDNNIPNKYQPISLQQIINFVKNLL